MKITKDTASQLVISEIGNRIQKYRLDINMKQSVLSKKSGVSIATVRRIEAGEDVSMSKIVAVLLALGLASNLDYLVPESIINPIEISNMGHSRKRATTKKTREEKIKWGD